jgi:hypothetical protein
MMEVKRNMDPNQRLIWVKLKGEVPAVEAVEAEAVDILARLRRTRLEDHRLFQASR